MLYYKKMIIIIVILLFFGIIYQLFRQKQQLLSIESFQEGAIFAIPTKNNELSTLSVTSVPAGISDTNMNTLALNQYCMKASYNTAFTGNYINKDMVKYVLSRGCRFLDFEIYPNVEAKLNTNLVPTVSCKIKTPQSTETLLDILNTIGIYGYSGQTPNKNDPIFINMRIYANENKYLYTQIADVINKSNIKSKLYVDSNNGYAIPINMNTDDPNNIKDNKTLQDIKGKIIIILDTNATPDYNDDSKKCSDLTLPKTCRDLNNCINIFSGNSVRIYTYSSLLNQRYNSPTIYDNKITTSVNTFNIIYPDNCTNIFGLENNPSYFKLPVSYGVQVVMWPFYKNDDNLAAYEMTFAKSDGSAFVTMAKMINYINNKIYPTK